MNCPLCQKELVKFNFGVQHHWECPTQVDFNPYKTITLDTSICHFIYENHENLWLQEWILIPPYKIQTNYSANTSTIYKLHNITYSDAEPFQSNKPNFNFKEIMSCPLIKFTSETNLLNKIKTFIMFS